MTTNAGPSAVPTRPRQPINPAGAYGPPFKERSSSGGVQPRSATPLAPHAPYGRVRPSVDLDRHTPLDAPRIAEHGCRCFYGKPLSPRTGKRCGATLSASRTTGTWKHSSHRPVQPVCSSRPYQSLKVNCGDFLNLMREICWGGAGSASTRWACRCGPETIGSPLTPHASVARPRAGSLALQNPKQERAPASPEGAGDAGELAQPSSTGCLEWANAICSRITSDGREGIWA
jgi:hypothetical protein